MFIQGNIAIICFMVTEQDFGVHWTWGLFFSLKCAHITGQLVCKASRQSSGLHAHPVMWYHIPHEQKDAAVRLQKPKNLHPLNLRFSGRVTLVMICFFWSILPATYLLSFLFSVPLTGFTRMAVINVMTGISPSHFMLTSQKCWIIQVLKSYQSNTTVY